MVCLSCAVYLRFLHDDEVPWAREAEEGWWWPTWFEAEELGVWSAGWS